MTLQQNPSHIRKHYDINNNETFAFNYLQNPTKFNKLQKQTVDSICCTYSWFSYDFKSKKHFIIYHVFLILHHSRLGWVWANIQDTQLFKKIITMLNNCCYKKQSQIAKAIQKILEDLLHAFAFALAMPDHVRIVYSNNIFHLTQICNVDKKISTVHSKTHSNLPYTTRVFRLLCHWSGVLREIICLELSRTRQQWVECNIVVSVHAYI